MPHRHSNGSSDFRRGSGRREEVLRGAGGASLDLGLLRTFLTVYRVGSFTAAGRLLRMSQPTVTSHLRDLESRMGRRLFERLPRGVDATAAADELATEVAGPLDRLEEVAERTRSDVAAPVEESVHLAGPAELLCERVLPSLAPLVARGVRLRVTTGLADDLLADLRTGQFDLVVSAVRPRGRGLTVVTLVDEEFVLVAAPVWAEWIGTVTRDDPDVLRDVPLVAYAEDLPIVRRYWRHVFGKRLNARADVVVPDLRGVLSAVAAGAGITVLPRYLCTDELTSGALVPLLEPADPPINTLFLAQRTGIPEHDPAALVREQLQREARTW